MLIIDRHHKHQTFASHHISFFLSHLKKSRSEILRLNPMKIRISPSEVLCEKGCSAKFCEIYWKTWAEPSF